MSANSQIVIVPSKIQQAESWRDIADRFLRELCQSSKSRLHLRQAWTNSRTRVMGEIQEYGKSVERYEWYPSKLMSHYLSPVNVETVLRCIRDENIAFVSVSPDLEIETANSLQTAMQDVIRLVASIPALNGDTLLYDSYGVSFGSHRVSGIGVNDSLWHRQTNMSIRFWAHGLSKAYYVARRDIINSSEMRRLVELTSLDWGPCDVEVLQDY